MFISISIFFGFIRCIVLNFKYFAEIIFSILSSIKTVSFGIKLKRLIANSYIALSGLINLSSPEISRPSNKFKGVNYAALNKDNGCRESFIPRNSKFIEIDISAYHPTLASKLIGYKFPTSDIHSNFA